MVLPVERAILAVHHTRSTLVLRDNIGLVWRKCYTSKLCQFKVCSHHPLYYCIMFTRSSLSCLLAFYGILIFHTFLECFYLLVSFPFLLHSHAMVCNKKLGISHKKVILVALSYRLRRFVVIHITSVHQVSL